MKLIRISAASICLLFLVHGFCADKRYFPDDGFDLGGIGKDTKWGDKLTNYDNVLKKGTTKVGTLKFDYNIWTGIYIDGNVPIGGGAVAGGLWLESGWHSMEGWALRWIQIVKATKASPGAWGEQNGKWFPDTGSSKSDPSYPFQFLPVTVDPAPTQAMQDFPLRARNLDFDSTFEAELALACLNETDKKVMIFGSFYWGFDISEKDGDTLGVVTGVLPNSWGAPSEQLTSTMQTFFDGKNGRTKWTFEKDLDFNCIVPEPVSMSLLGLAGFSLLRCLARRRASS